MYRSLNPVAKEENLNEYKKDRKNRRCMAPFGTELGVLLAPLGVQEMAFEADAHICERYYRTQLVGAPVDPRYASARQKR